MKIDHGKDNTVLTVGFGGGCHWCTEAVFQSLRGVITVDQGFIKSHAPDDEYSEAVLVTFDRNQIPLDVLIDVHLRTHASTSSHTMRAKYRSAVYVGSDAVAAECDAAIGKFQPDFQQKIITKTLKMVGFKPSPEKYQDYYKSNPKKAFCEVYIDPKLSKIRQLFGSHCTRT